MAKDVTPVKVSSIPVVSDPELAKLYGDYAGAGTENLRMRDIIAPRLKLLQALSDEVKIGKPNSIDGAIVGDYVNTATKQVLKRPHVVLVHYDWNYIEWKPNRGGLVKNWLHDDSIASKSPWVEVDGKRFARTPDGNVLQETAIYYALEVSGEIPELVIMSLASVQFKHAKALNTKYQHENVVIGGVLKPAPIFFRTYYVDAQPVTVGKNDWMEWKFTPGARTDELPNSKLIFSRVVDLRKSIEKGEIKVELEDEAPAEGADNKPF